jgi:NADH dehydrogenase FAD-containing subunit
VSTTGAISVLPTFQLADSPYGNIFALGDVIDLPGPKMGRAAALQGTFVAGNIIRAIKGDGLKSYKPSPVDTSIELTLGLVCET